MFVYMFCTSVRVYECAWRGAGGNVMCSVKVV